MSQKFLHDPDIGATFQKMRGERMPQRMRAHLLSMFACMAKIGRYNTPDSAVAQPLPPHIEKQRLCSGLLH